jgi:hypothetical protein
MKKLLLILIPLAVITTALVIYFKKPTLISPGTQTNTPPQETPSQNQTPGVSATTATTTWSDYTNHVFCYSLSYPNSFTLTTSTEGLANLKNYSSSIELHEAAAPPGVAIQIQRAALPASTTFNVFIEKENAAIAADNLNADPEDVLSSGFSSSTIGVFRFSQETFAGPGGKFTAFLAPALDETNYYNVLIWNKESDTEVANKILTSFKPEACQ